MFCRKLSEIVKSTPSVHLLSRWLDPWDLGGRMGQWHLSGEVGAQKHLELFRWGIGPAAVLLV